MPEPLLIPRHGIALPRKFLKNGRVNKSSAGRRHIPHPRVMPGEMPGCRAAHGKAAHRDAVFIDRIMFANIIQRLKSIRFTGELERVAIAPVRMQHDSVLRRELTAAFLAFHNETQFATVVVPPVKPEIQPERARGSDLIRWRHY